MQTVMTVSRFFACDPYFDRGAKRKQSNFSRSNASTKAKNKRLCMRWPIRKRKIPFILEKGPEASVF